MGSDKRKQDKRRKRELKNVEQERYAERVEKGKRAELVKQQKLAEHAERERLRRERYPKVEIDPTNGDKEFVELVRVALAGMDFDDPVLFEESDRIFYRLMKDHGSVHAFNRLREAMKVLTAKGHPIGQIGEALMAVNFGTKLLGRIPEESRRRLMPYNDMFADLRGHEITLRFTSMLSEKGVGGTIFYSRREPKVDFDGKQWIVAFSRHAVEQICMRLSPDYIDYAASGDLHVFFSTCIYVEPVLLRNNQPAFVLYDQCDGPGYRRYRIYVEDILGKDNVDPAKGKCYYRVGYCPVVFEKRFAKAKTFLYPGYSKTPEYDLIMKAKLSWSEKEMLIQHATTQNATEVIINDNASTIKWVHDNGLPQVVQMKHKVFVDYADVYGNRHS